MEPPASKANPLTLPSHPPAQVRLLQLHDLCPLRRPQHINLRLRHSKHLLYQSLLLGRDLRRRRLLLRRRLIHAPLHRRRRHMRHPRIQQMRRGRRLILPVLLLWRRRLSVANGGGAWRRDLLLRWWLRGLAGFLDDGGEGGGVDEAHEEEGLEDGVGELGGLFEELGRFGGVAHDEAFHLGEDVEELGDREGGERLRDGVGAGEAGG